MPITLTYNDTVKNIQDSLYIRIVLSMSDPRKARESAHPTENAKQVTDNIICENVELKVNVFAPKLQTSDISKTIKKNNSKTATIPDSKSITYYDVYKKLDYIKNNGLIISSIVIEDINTVHLFENYIITDISRKRDMEEGNGNDIEITFHEFIFTSPDTVNITKEEIEKLSKQEQDSENQNSNNSDKGYTSLLATEIDAERSDLSDRYKKSDLYLNADGTPKEVIYDTEIWASKDFDDKEKIGIAGLFAKSKGGSLSEEEATKAYKNWKQTNSTSTSISNPSGKSLTVKSSSNPRTTIAPRMDTGVRA